MSHFLPGQRWISESEPELGLGRVVSAEYGRVEIEFPATDEKRMYAADNAPLKRVAFHVGDEVVDTDGKSFTVESTSEVNGCIVYQCGDDAIHESFLQDVQTFDKPETRLTSGHIDSWQTFDLRLKTHEQHAENRKNPVRGLLGSRIDLIPHQLYIAHEVSRRDIPRVLLADEVGLGKTIEACLILHRMLVTGKIKRALILVPDALTHQWFVELIRRFSLSFSIFDESRCAAIDAGDNDENPFLDDQLIICGVEFLLSQPARAAQAVNAGWDMLIVDEAHHLEWSPDAPSRGYLLVEAIAKETPGVLLLTATPEQLGPESHFARLRLLDPHRYHDLNYYLNEHKEFERVVAETNELIDSGDEAALQDLLDRHGPGRVMFRNTRANMKGFPKRILHQWPLDKDPGKDARINWLAELLRKHDTTKFLVITQTKNEVMSIHDELQKIINVKTALFHEDMPILKCDRQAAWFAEEDGARLLIASEIGGEGRNFQFVQHLVLVHVPDDPEMLEQRIGRLDRIGQSGDINIHVPYIKGSPEEGRVRWYHEGLNAFEEALSGSHEIMMMFQSRLGNIDSKLIADTKKFRIDLKKKIEQGRDRLLELNSCRPVIASEVINQMARTDTSDELEKFLLPLFDHFGVNPEHLQNRDYLLKRTHLFDSAFPLREQELHITYSRKQALAREDITLMTWDHPMIDGAIELLLGSEAGNASVAISDNAKGTMLQAVFILECIAPPELELSRFLPPTPISVIAHTDPSLDGRASVRPRNIREPRAWELVELESLLRTVTPVLVEKARELAEKQVESVLSEAKIKLLSVVGEEVKRLVALKKVNDHIRDEEVSAAVQRLQKLDESLTNSKLRFDAVLLITGTIKTAS